MRHGAAALLVVAVAAAVAGCAPGPSGTVAASLDELPTTVTASQAPSAVDEAPEPMPSLSVDPSSAEPLSSIHRGPVHASITAVRQDDGKALGVSVNVTRAVDADPFLTADCGEPGDGTDLSIVVQDLAVESGIATATLGVPGPLDGPGSYEGVVTFLDAEGEAIRGAGQIMVGSSLDSGTFDVSDPGTGDHLVGEWECRAL
ncbi:hypothetical protein [Demequina zhanjiangensis]|uniref:Uncharacterized protein n=1 Tax=Demequina zhanjiangensis TaxID=3051659 RepID=A0ABT8G3U0_9MICO|nr:hypothetical protein [Demequina sp. SYSU T00b26]MDN4473763.1 hypothetical protein [Demequina sp. SYSU T00b26]